MQCSGIVLHLCLFIELHYNCRARLFDLAVSLLPGLSDEEIGVLFSAIMPALQVCQLLYILSGDLILLFLGDIFSYGNG